RKGGVTFAAQPQDHSQKVNKGMYRSAMRSIFSELIRQQRLVVVSTFGVNEPKTKILVNQLKTLGLKDVLIITDQFDENLHLAARNIINVDVREVAGIDPVSLIRYEKVLITVPALKQVEELLR